MKRAPLSRLLAACACVLLLASCTHSRVVRRDYDDPRPRGSASAPRPASRAESQPLPSSGLHVVSRGETLYGISFRYGLRYQDVAAWNGIADPYTIEVGQRLRLRPASSNASIAANVPRPAALSVRPVANPTPAAGANAAPARPAGNAASGTRPPIASGPTSRPPTAPVARPPAAPVTPVVAGPAPTFRWPTRGQIIGRYVAGDRTQQGINIAGSAGQPVLASADGVVVYSGAGLVGYGELVIIKHSDEWLSAYAHNRKRLVAEGARVKAGDAIAEMGRTGALRDMLHFEIRRNGKPVDPLEWLPSE